MAVLGACVGGSVGLSDTRAAGDAVEVADAAGPARGEDPEHAVTSRSPRRKYARGKVRIDGA